MVNLGGEARQVDIEGLPGGDTSICTLDAASFEQCVSAVDGFAATRRALSERMLSLAPYAVVRIEVR